MNIKNIIIILLFAVVVGLIVYNLDSFKSLQKVESRSQEQETIECLSNEIIELKNKLSAKEKNNFDTIKPDIENWVNAYYNSPDNNKPIWERLDEIKKYSTRKLIESLKPKTETPQYNSYGSNYVSKTSIVDFYTKEKNETQTEVLLMLKTDMNISGNGSSSDLLTKIEVTYDSEKHSWLVDEIEYSIPIQLNNLK